MKKASGEVVASIPLDGPQGILTNRDMPNPIFLSAQVVVTFDDFVFDIQVLQ